MMRLRSLNLQKFGHFVDQDVAFGPGLTVVYGDNEDGKSTLLDGLGGFLWGVRNKNRRAFTYTYGNARITGRLESGGIEVAHVRSQNRLTCDGNPLDPPWGKAGPAGEDEWRRTFGMDLDGLRTGGQAVVHGSGDLADLIAMAETGEAIGGLLARLQARAEAIYKDRKGAGCEVRTITGQIAELTARIDAGEASAADVADLQTRIGELRARKAALHAEMVDARREQRRLEELQRCFAPAAVLREARQALQRALQEGAVVGPAETRQLADAVDAQQRAADAARQTGEQLTAARRRRGEHTCSPDVLAAAAGITGLREQLGSRREDRGVVADTDGAQRLLRDVADALGALGSPPGTDPMDTAQQLLLGEQVHDQLTRYAQDVIDAQRTAGQMQARVAQLEQETADAAAHPDDGGERDVVEARQRREDAWQRVRGPWISGQLPEPVQRETMARAVDDATAEADDVAQTRSDALEAIGRRRGEAAERDRHLQQAHRDRGAADDALRQAQDRWTAFTALHPLPAGLDPAGWQVHQRLLQDLRDAVGAVRADRLARDRAQQRLTAFEQDVAALAGLAPGAGSDPFDTAERLGEALDQSRAAQMAVDELDLHIGRLEAQQTDQQRQASDAQRVIEQVTEGIGEPAATVLDRSQRRLAAHDAVRAAEQALRQAKNPDSDLEALAEAAAATDSVALDDAAQTAGQRVGRSEAAHDGVAQQLGAAEGDLVQLTSREPVGHLVAERVERASNLRCLVEEYQVLVVQIEMLQRYKQWLADTSDSAVLDHAGQLLAGFTGGRFTGFDVVEEHGARRIDVRLPGTDGGAMELRQLSEGSADQVFLALRLAGIAVRLRQREEAGLSAVPVVLDDVLMSFDDRRAAAALRAMAGLGDQMQIIVLTHQRSVADAAAAIDGVQVSDLSGAARAAAR